MLKLIIALVTAFRIEADRPRVPEAFPRADRAPGPRHDDRARCARRALDGSDLPLIL